VDRRVVEAARAGVGGERHEPERVETGSVARGTAHRNAPSSLPSVTICLQ